MRFNFLTERTLSKGDDMKNIMLRIAALGAALVIAGCTGMADKREKSTDGLSAGSDAPLVGSVSMSVLNSRGTVIYSDALPLSSFQLRATEMYTLRLDTSNVPASTTFSLELTNISVVGSTPIVVSLASGDNVFSVPVQGTYALRLTVSASGMAPRVQSYQLAATCPNPTFTADSLNAASISVAGNTNIYSFSSAGVAAGANGMAPYECAWDPTGVGIVDTGFQSCDSPSNNFYSDLVGLREVGLVVRDACGVSHTVTEFNNLNYTVPTYPGNQFIFGQTASGCETCDPRYENVEYLATNAPVDAMYGNGTFTIESVLEYDMPSSIPHGIKIVIRGITEPVPLNAAAMTGSIDVSAAYISELTFTTDRGGDSQSRVTLTANPSSCTFDPRFGRVIPVAGTPCADGSGTNNRLSIEVYGDYRCNVMSGGANGNVVIQGQFDGTYDLVDGCVGGGGQGGGIPPIPL